jgi:hypothetical protein
MPTGADVAILLDESVASALRVCGPLANNVVSSTMLYGLVVTGAPRLTLSTLNCTLLMDSPVPAVAVAVTVTLPEAVAPAMGDVIATAVLVLLTVMLTGDDVAMLPPESVATATRECVALVNLVESSTTLYGLVVTGAPSAALSTLNCTLAMVNPDAAVAVAVTPTLLPDTVAPGAGAVIDTAGLLFTVMPTGADIVLPLDESVAIATSE